MSVSLIRINLFQFLSPKKVKKSSDVFMGCRNGTLGQHTLINQFILSCWLYQKRLILRPHSFSFNPFRPNYGRREKISF